MSVAPRYTPGGLTGGHLTGRWRYARTARRGIALRYDCSVSGPLAEIGSDVHSGERFIGRWRYSRVVGRGIALNYERSTSGPRAPTPPDPGPAAPVPTHSPTVRVLCSCGDVFAFDGDAGICPGCGRPAEWPTMGVIEREMRSDLDEMLRDHEHGAGPE